MIGYNKEYYIECCVSSACYKDTKVWNFLLRISWDVTNSKFLDSG